MFFHFNRGSQAHAKKTPMLADYAELSLYEIKYTVIKNPRQQ